MKHHSSAKLGLSMVLMLGILSTAHTTTVATRHTSRIPGENEFPTLFPFSLMTLQSQQTITRMTYPAPYIILQLHSNTATCTLHYNLLGVNNLWRSKHWKTFSARTFYIKQLQRLSIQ